MPTYDEVVQIVRQVLEDDGLLVKIDGESTPRWRVKASGIHQMGQGEGYLLGFGATPGGETGRTFFEISCNGPISLVLNDTSRDTDSAISLTAENGQLVIRDERKGADYVIARIGPEPEG
jgi:hypothetical protein